ncbi:MAG: M29 family metallopeptidase [Anaerolineae bacterium]
MDTALSGADMVPYFLDVLKLCQVRPQETVLVFTDPQFPHGAYSAAALGAARALGANVYLMVSGSDQNVDDKLVRAAWTSADLILGMSFLPGTHSWMYAPVHTEALAAGARVLMIQEPPEVLKRMLPTAKARRRGLAGVERMEKASTVRLVTGEGAVLTLAKQGRKSAYQCGVADVPGRWDHWPSGMVYCAPQEDSAEGTLVIKSGDVLLGSRRHAQSEVRLSFAQGRVTRFEGGPDAQQMEEYLRAVGDEASYRVAHAGWGTDPRADWRHVGMDSESLAGSVTIALGRNTFDSPVAYCGLGGSNQSRTHFDICLRTADVYLDDELVLHDGRFVGDDRL